MGDKMISALIAPHNASRAGRLGNDAFGPAVTAARVAKMLREAILRLKSRIRL